MDVLALLMPDSLETWHEQYSPFPDSHLRPEELDDLAQSQSVSVHEYFQHAREMWEDEESARMENDLAREEQHDFHRRGSAPSYPPPEEFLAP